MDNLLEFAERALDGAPTVRDAFATVRAIIGPTRFPRGEELAQEAMEALRQGKVPTPMQRAALLTVIKALRPSVLCSGGLAGHLPPYKKHSPRTIAQWQAFQAASKPLLYSIGRIDRATKPSDEPVATGFLVAASLLVTNKHVLAALSADTMELEPGQAVVRFGQEHGVVPDVPPVEILGVRAVHPDLDMALLEIARTDLPPLIIETASSPPGRAVVAVGYPQQDARNPLFTDVIFENKYKVKRAAPGELMGAGLSSVYHDCSTLGGNSGSPLLAMDTVRVVGLHRDGPMFLYRNEAVDAPCVRDFVQAHLNGG